MTKKAFMLISKEALSDTLRFYEKNVDIDSMTVVGDNIRFDLVGDGLPVEEDIPGNLPEQVKAQFKRITDDDKNGFSAPVFAKRNDEFPK